jgi:hypothetical protein
LVRFLLVLIAAALIAAGVTWLLFDQGLVPALPSFFYQTLLLLTVSTFFIYRYMLKMSKPEIFTQMYLLTIVVKLIAYLAYNLLVIREDPTGAVLNVVFFLVLYLVFTALEVVFLYRKITPR